MNFWKAFFSSCLGAFVALSVFTILVIFILVGMSKEALVEVSPNSILSLKLNYPISELELEDPISELIPEAGQQTIGLLQLKDAIAHAKDDGNIKGIYLNSGIVGGGIVTIEEIRSSLDDFQKSGKWVIAYSDYFTEGGYYLASIADTIFLNPEGMTELNGLATQVTFYKNLFDKLEIRPQVFRVGDFKSAVEPYLRDNLSDENKLQLNSLLHSVYSNILNNVAASRNIDPEKVKDMANKMLVRSAEDAKNHMLIDDLLYEDEVLDYLRRKVGVEPKEKINFIRYAEYKKSYAIPSSRNEIAVIVADGDIMPGKSDPGIVGSETIIKELRRARESKYVKAVVLRINSPGGSAQASDEMWREITLTSQEKPIIASMSDYAASGGYYLAMGCDTIVARPTTVTGSIGVFLVIPDLSLFLKNKLGITSEEVKTGEIGNLYTLTRELSETEKSILQKQTDKVYETFTSKAADGRNMHQDDLKKIASGRVWTGEQAKKNGLVDILGGLNDAIEVAAKKAGIAQDFKVRYYPKPVGLFEKYFGISREDVQEKEMKEKLGGENYILYKQWKEAKKLMGMQMRMPVEFSIN